MEDCGGSPPDGDTYNLGAFANPSGCTGEPLPQHIPYTGGGGTAAPVTYEFRNGRGYTYNMYYHYYCTGQYALYDLTSDCTFGSNRVMDWINPSGPDESGGIFTSGQYNWAVYDTAGDGLDGGSGYYIQTRSPGGSWSTVQSITCLLYTSDAADDIARVGRGGSRGR